MTGYCSVLSSKGAEGKKGLSLTGVGSGFSAFQTVWGTEWEEKKERKQESEHGLVRYRKCFWLACRKDHVSNSQKLHRMQTPGKRSYSLSEIEIKSLYIFKGNGWVFFFFLISQIQGLLIFVIIGFWKHMVVFITVSSQECCVEAVNIQYKIQLKNSFLRNSDKLKVKWS